MIYTAIIKDGGSFIPNVAETLAQKNIKNGDVVKIEVADSEVLSVKINAPSFKALCQTLQQVFKIVPVNRFIAEQGAKLRQQKKIKLPNALIGATALVLDMLLITRNVKDFTHLPLEVINPMDNRS